MPASLPLRSSFPAAPDKPAPKRRYAPKSKGGCMTCRSRHVRCDHLRPRCSSCKRSSRQCGYASPTASASTSAIKLVFYSPSSQPPRATLDIARPTTTPCHSQRELRALRYFRDVVAERLAGYFDAGFWTNGVVRVAQGGTGRGLRHAVVAVASHWENVVVPGMGRRSTADWECDDFALKQYTLAITELRASMQGGPCKPSTVELLMSNLLFICLEMFQNHYESALRQLSSGLYLFAEWDAKHREMYRGGEDDAQRRNDEGGNSGYGEDELETQLAHIFKRLLTQSLFFPVQRLDARLLIPTLTPTLPSVPSTFTTPDQARDSFNDCISSLLPSVQTRSTPNPPRCEAGTSLLQKWSTTFADFRARSSLKLTELERRNCIILEMQRLAMYLYALSSSFTSEMAFDAWMDEFARLVELGRYIVETKRLTVPQGKVLHYPKFDLGLIAPLFLVASRCRHRKLRREAVRVLRCGPRQEGVWNSAILACVAERIIKIEEEGLEAVEGCGHVSVERRVRLEDAAILTAERKVAAVFVRGGACGTDGEVIYEMIPYTG